jgi:hypothetical protein
LCDDRGSSLGCHKKAEQTVVSCDEIRDAAGIRRILLPDHLYRDSAYDKWGNPIMPDGTRVKDELYHDESVRKVLASGGVLPLFRNRVKYPLTFHLPWSPVRTDHDRVLESTHCFEGRRVIITEKMDGENTAMYHDYIHLDGHSPEQRMGQESSSADSNNRCLSWDETVEYAAILDLSVVPVIYDDEWDEKYARSLSLSMRLSEHEGFVVRIAGAFSYGAYFSSVAKFVREEHLGRSAQLDDATSRTKRPKENLGDAETHKHPSVIAVQPSRSPSCGISSSVDCPCYLAFRFAAQ